MRICLIDARPSADFVSRILFRTSFHDCVLRVELLRTLVLSFLSLSLVRRIFYFFLRFLFPLSFTFLLLFLRILEPVIGRPAQTVGERSRVRFPSTEGCLGARGVNGKRGWAETREVDAA